MIIFTFTKCYPVSDADNTKILTEQSGKQTLRTVRVHALVNKYVLLGLVVPVYTVDT